MAAFTAPLLLRIVVTVLAFHDRVGPLPLHVRGLVDTHALLIESIAVVIVAPLVGVETATRASIAEGGGLPIARRCGLFAALFVLGAMAGSALLQPAGPVGTLAARSLTLWTAAMALSAAGAAAGRWLRHPLDAAMCVLVFSLAVGVGILVAGPLVDGAPEPFINAALLASPIVATASAADIDLLRGEPLYRFSPIAHSQFAYPEWPMACATYATVAVLCFAGLAMTSRKNRRVFSAERITL